MFKYYIQKIFVAIGIFFLGIIFLSLLVGLVFWVLSFNLTQQTLNSPLYIAVSIGGIAATAVAIVEGMLSLWRYYEKKSETNNKRAIINVLSSSPMGRDFDSIRNALKDEKIKNIPDQIIQNLLDDLVMTGTVRVRKILSEPVLYALIGWREMMR